MAAATSPPSSTRPDAEPLDGPERARDARGGGVHGSLRAELLESLATQPLAPERGGAQPAHALARAEHAALDGARWEAPLPPWPWQAADERAPQPPEPTAAEAPARFELFDPRNKASPAEYLRHLERRFEATEALVAGALISTAQLAHRP